MMGLDEQRQPGEVIAREAYERSAALHEHHAALLERHGALRAAALEQRQADEEHEAADVDPPLDRRGRFGR